MRLYSSATTQRDPVTGTRRIRLSACSFDLVTVRRQVDDELTIIELFIQCIVGACAGSLGSHKRRGGEGNIVMFVARAVLNYAVFTSDCARVV